MYIDNALSTEIYKFCLSNPPLPLTHPSISRNLKKMQMKTKTSFKKYFHFFKTNNAFGTTQNIYNKL